MKLFKCLLLLFLWLVILAQSLTNWAGNIKFDPESFHTPTSLESLQNLVKTAQGKIRVIGSGHSFSSIVDTPDTIISLRNFNRIISCCENGEATVGGGMTYAELAPKLQAKGWALQNLAALPHISVAGATATSTHGSGVNNTGLAGAIKSLKFVDAQGDLQTLRMENSGIGPIVLGALGPIYEITLNLVPSYYIKQCVYGPLPFNTFAQNHKEILNAAYSVCLFTVYKTEFSTVWVKNKVESRSDNTCPKEFFGAKLFEVPVHPIPGIDPSATTSTGDAVGLWYEKLIHFRHDHTPSAGEELQAEFFVSRKYEAEAFQAVAKIFEDPTRRSLIQTSEVRTMAADGYDLSVCRDDPEGCLAIHCTFVQDWPRVKPVVDLIQRTLSPFDARPHWGKLFTFSAQYLSDRYYGPVLQHFRENIVKYDPEGKFQNSFVQHYIMESKKEDL